MKKFKKLRGLKRSALAATLLVIFGSGVTYAVLQSLQNTLTGNTISTATANLQLSKDGTNFGNSSIGFDFNNIVPGGDPVPITGYPFYLRNAGGTPLALKIAVTSAPSNPDNVDLSKVNVILTTVASGTPAQSFTLQSLIASANSGGLAILGNNLGIGINQQYKLQVSMDSNAVTGSSASLSNIDFAFTGIAQ